MKILPGHNAVYSLKRTKWQPSKGNISINTNRNKMILDSMDIYSERLSNLILRVKIH